MKYKVEGCIIPDVDPQTAVIVEPFSKWYDAENHFDAAGMFILEHPEVNCLVILVVGEDYSLVWDVGLTKSDRGLPAAP